MMYLDQYGRYRISQDPNELYHFGILGMKWGIRRFQPYPKGYTGDGKFTGDKTSNSDNKKKEELKTVNKNSNGSGTVSSEKPKFKRTGIKNADEAIDFIEKYNIPEKPKGWNGKYTETEKESAKIGLRALDDPDIDENDASDSGWMDWFIWEDQTIGGWQIADMARRGMTANEIREVLDKAESVTDGLYDDSDAEEAFIKTVGGRRNESLFEINYADSYMGSRYIDRCVEEAQKEKNLKHCLPMKFTINSYGYLVPDNYLEHHGILGMKWGKQNGPPYPLAYGRHSSSEKKAGWKDSLANVAKATGKGVAKAAKATGRAAKATGKGVAKAAKATKKGLIRLNLYPKKLMSDQDILDKVERLKKEDLLKHMRGKLTNEDKALMKIKSKDAKREVVKQTLSQLLPAIGKDLVISQIKNKLDYKLDIKKKEDAEDREWDKKVAEDLYKDARDAGMSAWEASEVARKLGTVGKGKNAEEIRPQPKKSEEEKNRDKTVWNDIYEDARAAGKSAAEARKAADEGDSSFAPRKKDNNQNNNQGFNIDSSVQKDIYETAKRAGFTATEAAELARKGDDSALKGQDFSANNQGGKKGKGNNGGNDQNDSVIDKGTLQRARNEIYEEWIKSGASHKEAVKRASELDDNVGKWKEEREKKAKAEERSRNAKIAYEMRKQKEETAKQVKSLQDAKDRITDQVVKKNEDQITSNGGKVISSSGNTIVYEDSQGIRRKRSLSDTINDEINKWKKEQD